jgi:hypothetical protein
VAVVVSVELVDGAPVVRHVAGPADAEHLRRTADRLASAAHPGVVPVLSSGPAGDGWELVTPHAGRAVTAAAVGNLARLAPLGATVAATLADLHDLGLVHGHLEAAHVLLGPDGTPVLTGLGPDDAGAQPGDDVAALGNLLANLAGDLSLGPSADAGEVARLDRVLASATGPAAGRPSARRLAAELSGLSDGIAPTTPRRRGRSLVVRLAALIVCGAFAAFVVGRAWDDGTTSGPRVAAPTAPAPTLPSIPVLPACAAVAGRAVDAGSCGFAASVHDGIVVVDGVQSVVGQAGDEVAVADFDCDGIPEPALVRPGTGEVLVFGPADATGARAVVRATRVGGATGFDLVEGEPRCVALRVVDGSGRPVPIVGRPRSEPS